MARTRPEDSLSAEHAEDASPDLFDGHPRWIPIGMPAASVSRGSDIALPRRKRRCAFDTI
jgi:hypothetical protein